MGVILSTVGGLAAIVLALLSICANALFGTLLTTGQERWLYGVLFGVLDVLKTLLPLIAAGAFTAGVRAKGIAALLVFGILTVLSLTASIGLYATTKSEMVGDARAAHTRYQDAVATREKAEAELAALGNVRPAGDIAGEIGALKRDRLYDRSKQCTDATATDSRDLCAKLERLAGEASKAAEAARLRAEIDKVRGRLQTMDVAAAMRSIDPQAEALARLISAVVGPVSPDTVRTALAVLVALLVELGSGLGPWLVSPNAGRRREPEPRERPSPEVAEAEPVTVLEAIDVLPAAESAVVVGQALTKEEVRRWAIGAVARRKGGFVPSGEARAAFHGWCAARGIKGEMNPTAFGLAMTALGYQRRKVGGDQRYLDIALVGAKTLRLAVDNGGAPRRALGDMRAAGGNRATT
ncbi:MAG TPA: hypothetical protein VGF29_13095 [Hyphomicrobiaceae bacterium]|jgi:hypothetical protein